MIIPVKREEDPIEMNARALDVIIARIIHIECRSSIDVQHSEIIVAVVGGVVGVELGGLAVEALDSGSICFLLSVTQCAPR